MTYEIKDPNAPATKKQTWAIKCLGGGDVRNDNLTCQEASDIIGGLKETVGEKRGYRSVTDLAMGDTISSKQITYGDLFKRAVEAGLKAGNDCTPTPMTVAGYEDQPVMGGVCGFAWVNFGMKKGLGRRFGQWLIKNDHARKDDYYGGVSIWVSDFGQSMERKAAYAAAMANVFQDAGIENAYPQTRMD